MNNSVYKPFSIRISYIKLRLLSLRTNYSNHLVTVTNIMIRQLTVLFFLTILLSDLALVSISTVYDFPIGLEVLAECGGEGEQGEEKEDKKTDFIRTHYSITFTKQIDNFPYKLVADNYCVLPQFVREIPVPPPDFA